MPIFKAKKLILAGDPMQLPPTILSTDRKRDKKSGSKTNGTKNAPKTSKEGILKRSSDTVKPLGKKDDDAAALEGGEASGSTSENDMDEDKAPAMPSDDAGSRQLRANKLTPPQSLETTLFDRLENMYGPGIKRLLNVQYRYADSGVTPRELSC